MKKVILFFIIFNFLISFSFAQIVNNRNVLNLKAQVLDDRVENNNNSNNNNGNNGGYVFNNLNISIPLELGAFSGKNALILKNLGNGPYSPFFSFFPGLTKFSMRADNDNLYFGVGDEAGFDPKISISKDGNLLIGASRGGNFLLFGYQNMIRAGVRFNPASGKLEYSNNVADPTSWKEFGFGTTTIIHTTTIIYQGSTSSPNLTLPLVLQGGSGINGIVLKNSGGGINAPFLTWESLGQKFSIRSDNNYLYFGSGDMAGFRDVLSISKDGDVIVRKIVSQIGGYTYYEYQKGGTVIQNWNLQKDRKFNFSSDWGISNLYRMNCDSDLKINCNNDNYLSNAGEPNEKYDLFIDVQVDTNSCSGRDCTNYCYAAILNDRISASAPNYCIYKPGYVVFNKVEKRSGGNNIVKGGNLKVENDLTIGGNLKFDNGVFIGTRVIPNGTSKYCGATQYANVSVFVENNKIKFKVCKKSGGCEVQEAILKPQFVDPNAEALNYNMFNISGVHLLISWGYIGRPSTFLRYYNNSWIATDDRNVSSFVYPEQAAYILEASGDTVLKRMICSFD